MLTISWHSSRKSGERHDFYPHNGRGRVFDNIFVERLWRSVKYEDIYPKAYQTVPALLTGLEDYFQLYDCERPHQSYDV